MFTSIMLEQSTNILIYVLMLVVAPFCNVLLHVVGNGSRLFWRTKSNCCLAINYLSTSVQDVMLHLHVLAK